MLSFGVSALTSLELFSVCQALLFLHQRFFVKSPQPFHFQFVPHCSCTHFPQVPYLHVFMNWVRGCVCPLVRKCEVPCYQAVAAYRRRRRRRGFAYAPVFQYICDVRPKPRFGRGLRFGITKILTTSSPR